MVVGAKKQVIIFFYRFGEIPFINSILQNSMKKILLLQDQSVHFQLILRDQDKPQKKRIQLLQQNLNP